ncbi:MAG: hypothetical protein JNK66_12855 [Chitinophagales bacterium]|nr:hypothetical protein [Chitinophagales bacterium]
MKNQTTLFFVMAAFVLLSACNQAPVAVPLSWNSLNDPKYDEQLVTLKGYAILPTITSGGGSIYLIPEKDSVNSGIRVNPKFGEENNQMKPLPANYTNADLQFKTDKGETGSYGDYIQVTGKYHILDKANYINEVTKIEKATP